MNIWYGEPDLDALNRLADYSIDKALGIRFTEIGPDYVRGTMPVDERTRQPFGRLHGGASVVLAESLGSTGANLCVNSDTHYCVGLDINANHIRGVREGHVIGTARPVHVGGATHVWEVHIRNAAEQLVCVSRLTMAVLARSDQLAPDA